MNTSRNTTAWTIAMAALGINLILGILYSWSVLKKALVTNWEWSNTEASLPYTVCVATFAFMMIFAGRAQDKYGPRPIALLGGLLFGAGLITSSLVSDPTLMVLTFGVIGGMGIGFGYSAVTPCAIKWFEPSKKGLISGIVVSGVGLSPVYIAPLTNMLLKTHTIEQTFLYLGVLALAVITLFALILKNPGDKAAPASPSQTPAATPASSDATPGATSAKTGVSSANTVKNDLGSGDYTWKEMIRTRPFILLWLSYLMSAAAGLMLIGHMASIAGVQAKWQAGFLLVVVLSVFNALGRVAGGILSDKAGRTNALLIVFLIQAVNMFAFSWYQSIPLLIFGSALAGLAYGSLFALFPAVTADFFGIRNLGVNYGLVFSGWGVAGIIGPIIGGIVADQTGTYNYSYIISAVMLLAGALMVRKVKAPVRKG